ncbi:hypothetical protein GLOIN_2v1829825 [Rhizophagus clarus]|uniref:Uncharacterized protein n=1 Tax=Rhizophagus clarus TaxID=94130 RepID=A0A8H3QJY2_9GLOM|nr:hypothetical protein GLOIN_2v1829825 [Rhizophagus clarus]
MGKNIQVPYIGQKKCGALQEYHPLVFSTESSKYARYICMACYEEKALEAIGYWILDIAASEKSIWQNKLLIHLVLFINQLNQEKSDNTLDILTPSTDTEINVPSLFITFIIFALIKFKYDLYKKLNPKNLTPKNFFEFGEALAHSTLLAKNKLKLYKKSLESPNSIEKYHTSFPLYLVQFYDGLLRTLYEQPKFLNYENINKQITFFVSIILNIAFKGWKIWLPQTMASLCYPTNRILHKKNIWNLGIIDNIDFKETTFGYGNIFDAIRGNSHATLRILFQYQLPELPEVLKIQEIIFEKLLAFNNENFTYQSNFDESNIRNEIMTYFKVSCNFSPPNIVILNAEDPPSNDSVVHECLKMYANEIGIENDGYINVVADEAIFRRDISFCKSNNKTKIILDQWHTNKDMMSALITIFSGYGIFNMAGILGVRYLDKLEKGVDFRTTSKVLELIWAAVGLAIHLYAKKKKQNLNNILEENKLIKV